MKLPVLLRPVAVAAHLFAVFCVGLACALGFWQFGSWQDQRDAAAAKHVERTPVALAEALGPDQPFPKSQVGRTVTLDGTWLTTSTFYVDDRDRRGETGYWVVTPLAIAGPADRSDDVPALLVVRGWVARLDPRPEAPTGKASLTAWLQPPEGAAGLVDPDRSDDVIPQIRMADAIQRVDQDLYGAYAVVKADADQTNPGNSGLEPVDLDQVPEVAATTGWRNLLYGAEWLIFAGFALFIWIRWCLDEVLAQRAVEVEDAG
ncbi:SURF1 family protein [Nocardioides gilvus]|uniref:SURF1 family protein n=1 Tax=Nocardioides gilvus TaxID=1735589 RepID=UPI0013A556FA|nr:SURF1 family protein [Nocardioides gilvus]